jgi:hypothetical protein
MANMIPISTVTVGSGGATAFAFTNIPQNYTDLIIKVSARGNYAGTSDQLAISFNGSTSSYSYKQIYGLGTAGVGSQGASAYPDSYISGASATASTFGNTDIYIPNYTSSNNKSLSMDSVGETNGGVVGSSLTAGIWSNTAPITSISVLNSLSGTFLQYSTATLYGIRKY